MAMLLSSPLQQITRTLTLARCEFYSPGKCRPPLNKAMSVPEIVYNQSTWKWLAVREMHRFTRALATAVDTQTCQSLGILSIGLDEVRLATSSRGKADMRYMADLARAGHFLMLRF